MTSETCGNCHYWHPNQRNKSGLCKRYPPIPVVFHSLKLRNADEYELLQDVQPEWPITREDDSCGEYKKDNPWR